MPFAQHRVAVVLEREPFTDVEEERVLQELAALTGGAATVIVSKDVRAVLSLQVRATSLERAISRVMTDVLKVTDAEVVGVFAIRS